MAPLDRAVHEPAGFFYLRTPLLPFERFVDFFAGDGRPGDAGERIRALLADPAVREGIWTGSAELLSRAGESGPNGRAAGIELAVLKYFTRMACRPTPFGVLAGCSFGTVGAKTEIGLRPAAEDRRDVRRGVAFLADACARA